MKRPAEPWEKQAQDAERARKRQLRDMDAPAELTAMMQHPTEFRSVQREALTAIQQDHSQIVVVMPTGAGKSLRFMLPAWVQHGGVTIVVVPLRALRQDMMHRAAALGLACAAWVPMCSVNGASIVLVTPEKTKHPAFGTFLSRLRQNRQLDRIVIDECHVILQNAWAFRRPPQELCHLAAAETQMVLLTATLPPTEEGQLLARMHWRREEVRLIRSSTVRDNNAYRVVAAGVEPEEWGPQLQAIVQPVLQQTTRKVVVMCRRKDQISAIIDAALFPCEAYHAGLGELWKNELLDQLRSGALHVLVATSAFGMGVDIPDIGLVVHLDAPDNLLEYSQASGRAGRDGAQSHAVLLQSPSRIVDPWMQQFAQATRCRRLVLQQYLDGTAHTSPCQAPQTPCDWCQQQDEDGGHVVAAPSTAEAAAERSIARQRSAPLQRRRQGLHVVAHQHERTRHLIERWKGRCLPCAMAGANDQRIVLHCSRPASRACLPAVQQIQREVRYVSHLVCYHCGVARELCDRWSADGRIRVEPAVPCQFYGVLAGIVGSMPRVCAPIWRQWRVMAIARGWTRASESCLLGLDARLAPG